MAQQLHRRADGRNKLCTESWGHGAVLLSPVLSLLSCVIWAIPNPHPKLHFPSVSGIEWSSVLLSHSPMVMDGSTGFLEESLGFDSASPLWVIWR